MADPFLGEIRLFGFNFAPYQWAFCSGQSLSISQYSALYSLLGTLYGGNGTSNFNLPLLTSRAPIGADSASAVGVPSGSESVALTTSNVPTHGHTLQAGIASTSNPSTQGPGAASTSVTDGLVSGSGSSVKAFSDAAPNTTLSPLTIGTQAGGGNVPHENRQPYLAVNFCIALYGTYPTFN